MKILTRQQNALIPSYALCYLCNGDRSGLDQTDISRIDGWIGSWDNVATSNGGQVLISPTGDSEVYSNYPEFGLPCMVTECDITVLVPEDGIDPAGELTN
jgi:hypothetical protein